MGDTMGEQKRRDFEIGEHQRNDIAYEAISSNPRRLEGGRPRCKGGRSRRTGRLEELLVKYGLPMGNYGQLTPATGEAVLLVLDARLYEIARRLTKGTDRPTIW